MCIMVRSLAHAQHSTKIDLRIGSSGNASGNVSVYRSSLGMHAVDDFCPWPIRVDAKSGLRHEGVTRRRHEGRLRTNHRRSKSDYQECHPKGIEMIATDPMQGLR